MKLILLAITVALLQTEIFGIEADETCTAIQYVELGMSGMVNCNFNEGYFGVFWYNSTEYTNTGPIIYLRNSEKDGRGYSSGEFDIYPNGSLIINNATLQHDHFFTVIMLETSTAAPSPIFIQVVVSVKPTQVYPQIDSCGNERICVSQVRRKLDLKCRVTNARPAALLLWLVRTLPSDLNVTLETLLLEESLSHTTIVKTTYSIQSLSRFALLMCKETSSHQVLKQSESLILLENSLHDISNITPGLKYIEIKSKMELLCSESSMLYLAWGKIMPDGSFSNLAYSIPSEQWNKTVYSGTYHLGTKGSLIAFEVGFQHEGIYACLYGDGTSEYQTVYEVFVYVAPIPAYPVVDGCSHVQYCVMNVKREGVLTCSLKGVRPPVELEWSAIGQRSNAISFSDKKTTIIEEEGRFNIILTSKFYITHDTQTRLTVACVVIAHGFETFDLSTQLDLLYLTDGIVVTPSERTVLTKRGVGLPGIIAIVLAALFSIAVVVVLLIYCKDTDGSLSKKTLLKQQLRQKYKNNCESFLPVPFLQNSVYQIQQLFVDGGIEDISVRSEGKAVLPKPLSSYRDILKLCSGTEQIIVEGDPGYGKTMLSLRLSYDWCTEIDCDIDVFILLKMSNLGGIKSLSSAIKKFLLPHDSMLSEGDIYSILSGSSSVVIVLDSFDKYPDASNYGDTFVKLIMTKQILANSTVILTTRPSLLPPAIPVTAKRIRLNGFTKESQNKYIQNVITERQPLQKTVDELFHTSAILEKICQVPLFFTLLVHITFDGCQSDQHDYPSMTSFFRDVVKYFHCSINEELEHISQHRNSVFKKQHFRLEKMAFKGLSKNHRKIFWSRKEFRHKLGDEFYNHCLNVGIFFEEDIKERESESSPEDSYKFISWVRFYHNTFCEWFAACHLARLAEKLSSNELKRKLKNIDPTNPQYVYRFACGLSSAAAEKIIRYLDSFKDGQKLAILCTLEQQNMGNRIMDTVKNLCNSPVNISLHDGRLFHVTALEFLKIASTKKIPVKEVWLTNMECSFKDSKKIVLKSDLELESIDTLLQLSIVDVGRQFSADDFLGLLRYSTSCSQLSVLRFRACILPKHVESCSLPEHFVERKITVEWNPLQDNVWFKLNLVSGKWEHQQKELKKEQYSQIVEYVGGMSK
ncbi:Protein NLRC5 [Holothuria leucospilota]|uniref:Protein NLRC5 n=1 Tax=Holothuria leucospilota TaxID=206669 RepID=A0A9Q1HKL7_HOLLE|nr:Protein NLRC5 [Holothuria leucospilota]